ncbi:hypothetical protein HRbin17_00599 [bacterium HR17]|uniref:VWFA domain-containing protein n=1 Tax=Candidatus Fervidibacter japonicus TaxID=2035412 RepID=A0A2H5XA88_9BACT|nr:hypothetical protein HRbin17_00599 [bacterium HR17]
MLLVAWGLRRKRQRLVFWVAPDSVAVWWRTARRQCALFGAATLLFALALTRPRWFAGNVAVPAQGVDVVLCLDVSHSMLCDDIKPSRLEFAQSVAANLLDRLQPDDRAGLVVFGGSGFPLCPLTHDRSIVRTYLSLLDPSVMVYNPTTYLAEGLKAALRLLRRQPDNAPRGGVIVLMSDGEDQGSDWQDAAAMCAKAGVPVFGIAIGTPHGAPVPNVTEQGTVAGYKRDSNGNIPVSRLNLTTLRDIARRTGGKVYLPHDGVREANALVADLAAYRQRVWTRHVAQWRELFPWLLALGAMLLVMETWLAPRLR